MTNKKQAIIISLIFVVLLVAGCIKQPQTKTEKTESVADLSSGTYAVAISQYADHEAMNACRVGFIEELQAAGIVEDENLTLTFQTAGADRDRAKLIATSYAQTDLDLIYCIGSTSSNMMLSTMHMQGTPIVFASVTDPVSAELSDADGVQRDEITGVVTPFDPEQQIQLVQDTLPDAKRIGIIYSKEEENSISCVERYRSLAEQNDMELMIKSVTSTHELSAALDQMTGKVDCLVIIQDNLVSSQIPMIIEKMISNKIPVFGCDEYQVQAGCIAAQGIDYRVVGKEAGKLAIEVLGGKKKASDITFARYESKKLYLNSEAANQMGVDIPENISEKADMIYDKIGEQGEE